MEATKPQSLNSKRGSLNIKDLTKSAFMLFVTALFSGVATIGINGLNKQSLAIVAIAAGSSTLAYVAKQLQTNSLGQLAPEPEDQI